MVVLIRSRLRFACARAIRFLWGVRPLRLLQLLRRSTKSCCAFVSCQAGLHREAWLWCFACYFWVLVVPRWTRSYTVWTYRPSPGKCHRNHQSLRTYRGRQSRTQATGWRGSRAIVWWVSNSQRAAAANFWPIIDRYPWSIIGMGMTAHV